MILNQDEKSERFYLHSDLFPHSERRAISNYGYMDDGHKCRAIVVANMDNIELYQIVGNSITFIKRYPFMCNIGVVEVIPTKGLISDILFIADDLGRYMFWTPEDQTILSDNTIRSRKSPHTFYKDVENSEPSPQFHGCSFWFNVCDTEGGLFYTIDDRVVCMIIAVIKGKLVVNKVLIYEMPYS